MRKKLFQRQKIDFFNQTLSMYAHSKQYIVLNIQLIWTAYTCYLEPTNIEKWKM